MNKRQAKKAFKKKYGIAPEDVAKAIVSVTPSIQEAHDVFVESCARLGYALKMASNTFYSCMIDSYDNGINVIENGVSKVNKIWISVENYEALKNGELILEAKGQSPVLVVPVDDVVGMEVSNE